MNSLQCPLPVLRKKRILDDRFVSAIAIWAIGLLFDFVCPTHTSIPHICQTFVWTFFSNKHCAYNFMVISGNKG